LIQPNEKDKKSEGKDKKAEKKETSVKDKPTAVGGLAGAAKEAFSGGSVGDRPVPSVASIVDRAASFRDKAPVPP
jgi:hypothetical protein